MRLTFLSRTKWLVALVVVGLMLMGWYVFVGARTARLNDTLLIIPVSAYVPGTVRLDHGLWVARQPNGDFYAFQNRDPHKGEALNWVAAKGLFMQAAYYRADGSCVTGPCDATAGQGLYRVESRLDGANLVVRPDHVVAGGFDPEPTWMTDLKHFLTRLRPNSPVPAQTP